MSCAAAPNSIPEEVMEDKPAEATNGMVATEGSGEPATHNMQPARPWFNEPCLMGIDEAGRGPVIGPMVYGCVVASIAYRDTLATRAYADSKTLSEDQRESLFKAVQADDQLVYSLDVLSAAAITAQMLARSKVSLNEIAANSTIGLIQQAIDAGINLTEVYIDTVGDPDRYKAKLQRSFPALSFTVCPKADALYPAVSAASICAKVTRDQNVANLAAKLGPGGANLGTGYPSDPATQAWMRANVQKVFGWDGNVRFAWETCNRMLEEAGAAKVEFEADAPDMANQATLSFGPVGGAAGAAASESSGAGRHGYFRLRRLQRVMAGTF